MNIILLYHYFSKYLRERELTKLLAVFNKTAITPIFFSGFVFLHCNSNDQIKKTHPTHNISELPGDDFDRQVDDIHFVIENNLLPEKRSLLLAMRNPSSALLTKLQFANDISVLKAGQLNTRVKDEKENPDYLNLFHSNFTKNFTFFSKKLFEFDDADIQTKSDGYGVSSFSTSFDNAKCARETEVSSPQNNMNNSELSCSDSNENVTHNINSNEIKINFFSEYVFQGYENYNRKRKKK